MLTIICGEDVPASRDYYHQLKKQYRAKLYQTVEVDYQEVKSLIADHQSHRSLFFAQTAYFSQNVNKYISVRNNPGFVDLLKTIAADPELILIDWEENKAGREIKLRNAGTIKEFRPARSVFQLLDSCFPGNTKAFLTLFHQLLQTSEETFIFAMLARHVRALLLAKHQLFAKQTPPWQKHKLLHQTRLWTTDRLLTFYHGLYRIDLSVKTSRNPLGVGRSLDILACSCL
ncbi:hypothetical protein M1523_04240 [Patescibacteria group bacterium]|nr:hypothetical protein [Patescibacteria group bacterium]MCL5091898.1 hypothetical protein [Patescibacteria group bacterium]